MSWLHGTIAICRRELIGVFGTLAGWSVVALFLVPVGVVFAVAVFRDGQPASLRDVFAAAGWSMLLAAPAITMRAISEELRQGTWESLAAAPIGEGAIVVGKFLAALCLIVAMVIPIAVLALAVELHGRPDYGELLCGALGVVLAGALFASVGILASSVTSSQLVAYLLSVFSCLLVLLCCLLLPPRSSAWLAELLYAADPLRRLRDFTLGLFDTAHVVHAAALIAAVLATATWCLAARRIGWAAGGVAAQVWLRAVAALLLASAAIFFAGMPTLRLRVDATRTRAFALSAATGRLLATIDGEWRIAVVLPDAATDEATRRQIDEVLRRVHETNPNVAVARIDPTDPAQLPSWESLVASLQTGADEPSRRAFDQALDDGQAAFGELMELAREHAGALATLPSSGDAEVDARLGALRSGLAQLDERGGDFAEGIRRVRSTSPAQPVADEDGARAALVANHRHWAEQLDGAAAAFGRWAGQPGLAEPVRRHAARSRPAFEALAQRLAISQDRLARLPRPALAGIGRVLGEGEAAIVQGPLGVAVVPSWQLLAATTPSGGADSIDAALRVERRFRGEQAIAAAIRSLLRPAPMVVFVHAEERSVLRPDDDRNDAAGAADALRQARCDVREWLPSEPSAPAPAAGQPMVWIIVPPQVRRGVEIAAGERILLERTRRLLDQGESLLLTVARSVRPLFREEDPWSTLLASCGATVQTGRVVFEFDRVGPARGVVRAWQRVAPQLTGHPMSSAIAGERILFTHPTPLEVDLAPCGATILAAIEPDAARWLETDWRSENRSRSGPPMEGALDESVPVVAAIERRIEATTKATSAAVPTGAAASRRDDQRMVQRIVLVGSGGWLLSSVLDDHEIVGGRHVAANPGNRELLLASVDWLAGRDDEIATSPAAAASTRLTGIGPTARAAWGVVAIVGIPLASLALGTFVTILRRRP